ncbi:MAG: OB-fold nucleic acid binding domain-containing protein [Phycisphaerae bacterium]
MPRTFVNQLTVPGTSVEQVFQVAEKSLRTTRKGGLFIMARLRDRTGEMPAVMWDATEALFAAIPQDGYALVQGRVDTYNDAPQVVIEAMRPARDEEVDLADFLPTGPGDPEQHLSRLKEILDGVERPALRALVETVWEDEELLADLKRAPAAAKLHHAYLGGLLEHTLGIAEPAVKLCEHYERLDRDLLLDGVLWHDLGKTRELAYADALGYTDAGKLVGHIAQGLLMLEEKIRRVRAAGTAFPEDLAHLCRHLVLAHHGEHAFGSPKLPMTAEAMALHHLDNIDAKLHGFWRTVDADADPNRRWTDWNRMFSGALFKGFDQLDLEDEDADEV